MEGSILYWLQMVHVKVLDMHCIDKVILGNAIVIIG